MNRYFLIFTIIIFFKTLNAEDAFFPDEEKRDKPYWEIGAGLTLIEVPHYTGSDQSEFYALPFPFFVYQSDKVSLNREGLKRHVMETSNWDIDVSFAGRLPVQSEENNAREGMPDLDWVGLAGPSVNYRIYSDDNHSVKFRLPVHFAVSTDFTYVDYIGWEFAPTLRWEAGFENDSTQWRFITSASYYYGSDKYNDYYYSVDPQYATIDRPAYQATASKNGYQAMLGFTRRQGNFWMGGFLRYRSLEGADFLDSPLVRQNDNIYAGVAFAWIIHSSK